jgi:hypothetical protein
MALLMEYVVVCTYLYIGLTIPSSQLYKEGQRENFNMGVGDQEFGQVQIDKSDTK